MFRQWIINLVCDILEQREIICHTKHGYYWDYESKMWGEVVGTYKD